MSEEIVQHLDSRGVLTLTMNRPAVHNAFDEHQIARLTQAIERAATDTAVRVVVLASNGKNFCAGADIGYMQRMGGNSRAQNVDDAMALAKLMKSLNDISKPTVGRIQGAAFGGGVGLVCCCDIAVGDASTVLSLSEVKIGLVPATIAPYVVRAIGQRKARELFLTGERVSSGDARNIGLLHKVAAENTLDESVESTVGMLLSNSPNALAVAKNVIFNMSSDAVTDEMIEFTVNTIADVRESADGREGTAAFLEKRKPNWQL